MRRIAAIALCVIGLVFNTSNAATGRSSFEFLLVGSSSRAAAMSEAFTAVEGDVGGWYFNPALAARLSRTEFSLMHLKYIEDVSLERFSMSTGSIS